MNTGPDKPMTIRSPAQLKAEWNTVFPPGWMKAAADAMPHDMSMAEDMAMLGNGLAYFSDKGVEVVNAGPE